MKLHRRNDRPRIGVACLLVGLLVWACAFDARAGGDCGALPGGPPDCNGNGLLDACDIENCPDVPACDDCNLNGIPDECDISTGTSTDVDLNGVPDECKFFDDGGVGEEWNDPLNWDDDDVPNDLEEIDDSFVTIAAGPVNLDVHVEVDSCRVLDGSVLNVSGPIDEEFEISGSGDLQIASSTGLPSRLMIGEGREVSVKPGTVRVNSGGMFQAAAGVQIARIEAGALLIDSRCNQLAGGEMTLSQQMTGEVVGNVVLDATLDCLDCWACNGVGSTVAGGKTPPILRILDSASLVVGQDLIIRGPATFVHTSSSQIEINGSFINENPCPNCVQMQGRLVMKAPTIAATAPQAQAFEVFAPDLGSEAVGLSPSMILSEIIVGEGVNIVFSDLFANTSTGTTEALYVESLELGSGSQVTLDQCKVYYRRLINKGAVITSLGNGGLAIFVGPFGIPAMGTWGLVVLVNCLLVLGTILFQRRRRYA